MTVDLVPMPAPSTTRVGQRLLVAADDLFYDRGITGVGVDLLAEHAGTTKRTLYQRFGSKDGLVAAYLQQRAHVWQTWVVEALDDAGTVDAAAALDVVFATGARWAATHSRGCAFVNAWAELGSGSSPAVEVIADEKRWMLDLFTRLVGDAEVAADVHLVHEGAHVASSVLADASAYERAASIARRLLAEAAVGGDGPH